MKIFYITLNDDNEAKTISLALLEKKLAVCTNWFPITCAYPWEGEIKCEPEVVLIVKTKENLREKIEMVISEHIDYMACIAEIDIHSINQDYGQWLEKSVL